MQVEIFSLCDAATADGGKFNLLGAFDTIRAPQLPFVHSQCTIALRLRFSRIEEGDHKVTVHFVDGDGKNVIQPMQGNIKVKFVPGQPSLSTNLILNIQGLKLEKAGEYSIDLAVDGQHKASLPLFVKERVPA